MSTPKTQISLMHTSEVIHWEHHSSTLVSVLDAQAAEFAKALTYMVDPEL